MADEEYPVFQQPGENEQTRRLAAAQYERSRTQAREDAEALKAADDAAEKPRTWVELEHDQGFAAAQSRPMPDIGYMTPTPNQPPLPLIYSGKINGVHGDSEAGKSWLALHVARQEMDSGKHVAYIDFEDDQGSVYGRLLNLGCTESRIREFFHYINPQSKLTTFEQIDYARTVNMDKVHSLAVVDGVTEAMALENLTGRDEGEVAKWHQIVTKPLAAAGWGVFMIDHTPHGESRAIGSQHKRSAITGVSYEMESIFSFAPGQRGRSKISVAKDRPGWIRGEAAPGGKPQWYGDFCLNAQTASMLDASIWAWKPVDADTEGIQSSPDSRITDAILRFVQINDGCTTSTIREGVIGRAGKINWALDHLVQVGNVTTSKAGREVRHHFDHGTEDDGPSVQLHVVPDVVPKIAEQHQVFHLPRSEGDDA